jgi:hypothetical protein
MKEEVGHNWGQIASRITNDEVIDGHFANTYNAVLSETIPRLEQAVREKSGVSIFVFEVNKRIRTFQPARQRDLWSVKR